MAADTIEEFVRQNGSRVFVDLAKVTMAIEGSSSTTDIRSTGYTYTETLVIPLDAFVKRWKIAKVAS